MSQDKATLETKQLVDNLISYTQESMKWCAGESENAAQTVSSVIQQLMDDAKRISQMSDEALKAVQEFRTKVGKMLDEGRTTTLIKALADLCKQHVEINALIYPVIEALQFQDRITQNMQNNARMMIVWEATRQEVLTKDQLSEADRVTFGQKLLKCTTMADEREVIRTFIPELPPEEKAVDDMLMF